MVHLGMLAFALHAVTETAAGLSFMVHPEGQLPGCTPAARLILQQYGGLLLASSMACLIVVADPSFNPATARLLAVAFGSYHAWPCHRALARIRNETRPRREAAASFLGDPVIHLLVHVACLGSFLYTAVAGP
ncbi:hypothetical protein F4802DRAFT_549267 [Xylaria palmicola]|nr:hypothetical protein F4802DRAFT_549267 [Xylaria palmicola]